MNRDPCAPRLVGIRLHPIKSLDPVEVKEARIGPGGGLEHDRVWALYSSDGRWINGKRTAAIHLIRAAYAPDVSSVTLSVPGDSRKIPTKTFAFPGVTAGAAQWFTNYFEQPVIVHHSPEGFPDDAITNGPTIISTASLAAIAAWFSGMTVDRTAVTLSIDDMRLRFRTTLEIDVDRSAVAHEKVPVFWEDQLFGERRTERRALPHW